MTAMEDTPSTDRYRLLGDQVFGSGEDHLGHDQAAGVLAQRILDSVHSTPFTVGITADWGMGKTSLMHRLRQDLTNASRSNTTLQVTALEFNPWTAHEGEIVEGLLKTVLDEVDSGLISRARRDTRLKRRARVATTAAASLVPLSGPASVVDALWQLAESDPAARNQLRRTIEQALRAWAYADSDQVKRLLVVFIDDLDRCTPASVLEMFEAIKVYMDVFGIVFVVAYDERVVADALQSSPAFGHYDEAAKREYLEKIIQLVYRLPEPGDTESRALVAALVAESQTRDLFNDHEQATDLIAEWTGGNPRRIKRLINALVVNRLWSGQVTNDAYLAGTALYMYYPDFLRRLNASAENGLGSIEVFDRHARMREAVAAEGIDAAAAEQHFKDSWDVKFADDDSIARKLGRIDNAAPGNYAALFSDRRFRSIAAMLTEGDAPDRTRAALREFGKQLSASEPAPAAPDDREARAVIAAVRQSKFEFRTAEGVASQVGLPVEVVREVFRLHPDQIRHSPIPDVHGRPLYAARSSSP
jgi:hypothetical protein